MLQNWSTNQENRFWYTIIGVHWQNHMESFECFIPLPNHFFLLIYSLCPIQSSVFPFWIVSFKAFILCFCKLLLFFLKSVNSATFQHFTYSSSLIIMPKRKWTLWTKQKEYYFFHRLIKLDMSIVIVQY